MIFDDGPGGSDDVPGLVPVKARGPDVVLELGEIRLGISAGIGVFSEKRPRYLIHPHVRALGRENGGHQKLQRIGELQSDDGIRVGRRQDIQNLEGSFPAIGSCHVRCPCVF